jgi:hypothetical protein
MSAQRARTKRAKEDLAALQGAARSRSGTTLMRDRATFRREIESNSPMPIYELLGINEV